MPASLPADCRRDGLVHCQSTRSPQRALHGARTPTADSFPPHTGHSRQDQGRPCSKPQAGCRRRQAARAAHCWCVPHTPQHFTSAHSQALRLPAGVIERRRQARRGNTAEFPGASGVLDSTYSTDGRNTPALGAGPSSGFDKVRLRGGGVPERRVGNGATTPMRREASPARIGQRSPSALRNSLEDERTPLIKNGEGGRDDQS